MNKTEATKLAKQLVSQNKSYSAIQTTLSTLGYANTTELLAELKIEKSKKKAIIDAMYEYLEAEPRTQEQFREWCEINGTENTIRWFKQHAV